MEFRKYQHVERYGNDETEGIENGINYVFYKIDGTNSSIWLDDDGNIACGSRNRTLELNNDNAGFMNWVIKQDNIKQFLNKYPHLRLYGEWLVKHSLTTYRDDAWKNFYVFDVCKDDGLNIDGKVKIQYLHYDKYKLLMEEFNINYIPPIRIIKKGNYDSYIKCLDYTGEFLIKDGAGKGEGIVIKNYDYVNKYGRQTWAKIVSGEFKEKHHKTMGAPIVNSTLLIEEKIIDEFFTKTFVEKEYSKIVNKYNGWRSKYIGEFIGRTIDEFIKEDIYNAIKLFKNPTINFKLLYNMCVNKLKEYKEELF